MTLVKGSESFVYSMAVEGIGKESTVAPDGRYRWCWSRLFFDGGSPSWDTDNLYRSGKAEGQLLYWPSQISSSLNFQQYELSVGSQTFELRGGPLAWSSFLAQRATPVAFLTAPMSAVTSLMSASVSTLIPGTILYIERECIQISANFGGGSYNVIRGVLKTTQEAHEERLSLYDSPAYTRAGRIVQLIATPANATSYADETVIWTGSLREIETPNSGPQIRINTDPLITLVKSTRLMTEQYTGRVGRTTSAQVQGVGRPDAGYTTDDLGIRDQTQRCIVLIDDRYAVSCRWTYESSTNDPDFVETRLNIIKAESVLGSENLDLTAGERFALGRNEQPPFRELISSASEQPANSDTPGTNTLPLSQKASIHILQLLTTTRNGGSPGANGPYDTGINNLAGRIPIELINVDAILEWGRRGGDLFPLDNMIYGLTRNETIGFALERILKPRGALLTEDAQGLLTIAQISDSIPYAGSISIEETDVVDAGFRIDTRIQNTVAQVNIEYAQVPGGEPTRLEVIDVNKGRTNPRGDYESVDIDAGAYRNDADVQGLIIPLAQRYSAVSSVATLRQVHYTKSASIGDNVSFSHSGAINPDGTRGGTNQVHLVTKRELTIQSDTHHLTYQLEFVGAIYASQGLIAPNAEVVSWNGGTLTITVQSNTFTTPGRIGLPVTDTEAFSAGDQIQIVDEFGTVQTALAEIVSTTATTIILLAAPAVAPAAGDIIRFAAYSSATSDQQERWAFVADPDDALGGSVTNAKGYTI